MKRVIVWSAAVSIGAFSVAIATGAELPRVPSGPKVIQLADKEPEHKHDHKKEGKEEEHKGEKKDLGKQKIGAYEVQVTQIGDIKPGEESIFIIKPKGEGEPKAVRAWVGVETGQGSIKTKGEEEKEGEWHAHHNVSKPLPAGAKLWIELETAAGKTKAAFALK